MVVFEKIYMLRKTCKCKIDTRMLTLTKRRALPDATQINVSIYHIISYSHTTGKQMIKMCRKSYQYLDKFSRNVADGSLVL